MTFESLSIIAYILWIYSRIALVIFLPQCVGKTNLSNLHEHLAPLIISHTMDPLLETNRKKVSKYQLKFYKEPQAIMLMRKKRQRNTTAMSNIYPHHCANRGTQDETIRQWELYCDQFLEELIILEGRGPWASEICVRCSLRPDKYECIDCSGHQVKCRLCMVECHVCLPFHHIQVCVVMVYQTFFRWSMTSRNGMEHSSRTHRSKSWVYGYSWVTLSERNVWIQNEQQKTTLP